MAFLNNRGPRLLGNIDIPVTNRIQNNTSTNHHIKYKPVYEIVFIQSFKEILYAGL